MSGREILTKLMRNYKFRKKMKISSIVKENINFWERDIFINNDLQESVLKIGKETSLIMTEIFDTELSQDKKEVAEYIEGYVARKVKKYLKCYVCNNKII